MTRILRAILLAAAIASGCTTGEGGRQHVAAHVPRFRDVAAEVGIVHEFGSGTRQKRFIVEAKGGAAAAFFDNDDDGDLDLYVLNGSRLRRGEGEGPRFNALYRNDGGAFREVAKGAAVADTGWGMGVTTADHDNDGDQDLFVANFGVNRLYKNIGDGRFAEVGADAAVADRRWSTGCSFADYDRDGDLDLYVANYVDFKVDRLPPVEQAMRWRGEEVFRGPVGLPAAHDVLYRNNGDGTFADVTASAGVSAQTPYYGLGSVWGDFDDDGDSDLFVANDSKPNFLYRNNGDATFTETAREAGVGYAGDGRAQAGMGVAFDDFDDDGRLDLFVTNFSLDHSTLYRNLGPPELGQQGAWFSDVSHDGTIGQSTWPKVSWGVGFVDLDNDADKDLFIANGHVYPHLDRHRLGETYAQTNQLFLNLGGGRFADVSPQSGAGLLVNKVSRGTCFGDYDNDGDLDIFVAELDDYPTLLENETPPGNHWLIVKTVGVVSNRDGVGARVRVTTGSLVQTREVRAGDSFLSRSDPRLHFGLGSATLADALEVRWPSGHVDRLEGVEIDRVIEVREGARPKQ